MSEHPAISIIIPVYNVEEWLQRAVESLQTQTFDDFEVFLVDDGSTDASEELCDTLAREDTRLKALHRKNGGAASARNEALALAKGEYVYFMDGDDWCEPTMLEDMYSAASNKELDLVITGYYIDTYYSEGEFYRELRSAPEQIFLSRQEFRNYAHKLFDAQLLYAPWNKLYRLEYLRANKITFPLTFWDDLPFNLEVIRDVERVGCVDGHYYHFLRARATSENTKYRNDMYNKREEEHSWMCDLYHYWGIASTEVDEFLSRRYVERLVGCIENVTNKNCMLASSEKLSLIEDMISTNHARIALKKARPRSLMMKVVLLPLIWGNARLSMWEGAFISWVKRSNTSVFARLKANR